MPNAAPVLVTGTEVDDALITHIPLALAGACNGRLTLESGVAYSTSDQTAKTVVYFTPYHGSTVGLYDGSSVWTWAAFTEKSVKLTDTQTGTTTNGSASVTGLTDTSQLIVGMKVSGTGIAGGSTIATIPGPTSITLSANATASGSVSLTFKVTASNKYDVFGYASSSALKLELCAWTNTTTRATALTLQDGVLVKSGATTRRYLGTILATSTDGQSEDSAANRNVFRDMNAYNTEASAAATLVAIQTFTSSGTYTPTAGMRYCIAEGVGGGGGGGSCLNQTGTNHGAGGGGQAGTHSWVRLTAAQVGASQTVTIGAAGTGGTANSNNATNGGATSVGSLLTAPGGQGGAAGTDGGGGAPGTTGTTGTGDTSVAGQPGNFGQGVTISGVQCLGGAGGSGPFGRGGYSVATAAQNSGVAGTGYGAGGSGGISNLASATCVGGAGTAGYVRITEFF